MDEILICYDALDSAACELLNRIDLLDSDNENELDESLKKIAKFRFGRIFIELSNGLRFLSELDECKNKRDIATLVNRFNKLQTAEMSN
ncbi:MAG: hypothetical protein ACYCVH_06240 [Ignavibacteriaceae bacterium]